MVATRHSLPSRNTDDDAVDNLDSRELKRLHIDGKETLKGEKHSATQQRQSSGTYTWRGAVYVITPDTPQEWIDNDPTRPNKREKMSKSKSREPEEEGRRRTMGDSVAEEDEIELPRTRKRSLVLREDDDEPPAKRSRKSLPNLPTSTRTGSSMAPPARPLQRRSTRNVTAGDAEEEDDEAPTLGAADIMAGKQTVKVIAARKREAKKSGLNVTKLPARNEICGRIIATSVVKLSKINSRIAALRADYERLKGKGAFDMLLDRVKTKRRLGEQLQSREQDDEQDDEEDMEAAMTALETKRARQLLAGIDVKGLPSSPAHERSSPDPIALRHSPIIPESPPEQTSSSNADPAAIPTPTSDNNRPTQATPATSEEDVDNHAAATANSDSARLEMTPGPAASTAPSSPATVITTHKPMPAPPKTYPTSNQRTFTRAVPATVQPPLLALPSLPQVNRGGQALRWTPRLTEKVNDGERAENAIHLKRLHGETAAQKRRRVKRELREVQRWKALSEEEAAQYEVTKRVDEKQDAVTDAEAEAEAEESGWTIIRDPLVGQGDDEDEEQNGEEAYEHHDDRHHDDEGQYEHENERAGEEAAQRMMEKHRAGSRTKMRHAGIGGASGKRRSQPLY